MNRGKDTVPFLPPFQLLLVLGLILVESPAFALDRDAARPNIIFLMADDLVIQPLAA